MGIESNYRERDSYPSFKEWNTDYNEAIKRGGKEAGRRINRAIIKNITAYSPDPTTTEINKMLVMREQDNLGRARERGERFERGHRPALVHESDGGAKGGAA